jgi:hypothetical protein
MSETASTPQVQNETSQPIEQSYVYVQNLDSSEFPVTITLIDILGGNPPLSITVQQNGYVPIGNTGDAFKIRFLARVQVATPMSTNPPLVVDTLLLHPASIEPPISIGSQYIRVVIRNYQIPQVETSNV